MLSSTLSDVPGAVGVVGPDGLRGQEISKELTRFVAQGVLARVSVQGVAHISLAEASHGTSKIPDLVDHVGALPGAEAEGES